MKADNKTKPKFVHNAKVLWICGTKQEEISEMQDKDWALCKWWIAQHKNDVQYAGGKLIVVSMLEKKYKAKTDIKLCPNCNQSSKH